MFTSEGRNRTTGTVCDEKAGLVTTDRIGVTLGIHRLVFLTWVFKNAKVVDRRAAREHWKPGTG